MAESSPVEYPRITYRGLQAGVILDLRASGDRIASFTNTEGDQTIQTIATHYMVFRLPAEVPDTYLNEYCVACHLIFEWA